MKNLIKSQKTVVFGVGFATFFFGFGAGAILNLYLLATHSPVVIHFRSSLMYISSIFGDGIILPIVNMFVAANLFKNKAFIGRLTIVLSLFFGLLVTLYFHITQAVQGLVNWAMPKPWQWNFLGVWHALYMMCVASFLSLYFLVLIQTIRKQKKIPKEAFWIIGSIVMFFILLKLDYVNAKLI